MAKKKPRTYAEQLAARTTWASRARLARKHGKPDPRLTDPSYVTDPRNMATIQRDAQNAAGLEYGGAESQLAMQGQRIPSWFEQYKQAITHGAQQVKQAYDPLIAATQQTAEAVGKPVLTDVDPSSKAAQDDALAAASRQAMAGQWTSLLQANQGADQGYFGARQGVAGAAQLQALADLAGQQQQLARDKGAYMGSYVADARALERQYGLDREHQDVENKYFGLDVAKTQQAATQAAADAADDAQAEGGKLITSGAFAGYTNAQVRAMSEQRRNALVKAYNAKGGSKGGKKGGPTSSQTLAGKTDLRMAVAHVQQGLGPNTQPDAHGGVTGASPSYWNEAYTNLIAAGMDPAIARAAVQLVRHGRVGKQTRKTLRTDYGITKLPTGTRRNQPTPATINRPPSAQTLTGQVRPT
jgi:hypothetical protein